MRGTKGVIRLIIKAPSPVVIVNSEWFNGRYMLMFREDLTTVSILSLKDLNCCP